MEGPELAWDLKLLRPRPFTHIYHLGQTWSSGDDTSFFFS